MTERPPAYAIRRATPDDAVLLAELGRRTFVAAFGAANRPEDVSHYLEATYGQAHQARELAHPGSEFWIVTSGEALAGYCKLNHPRPVPGQDDAPAMELERIYADLPFVGRGLGAFLLQHVIDRTVSCGYRHLWLAVWEHNPRARRFYERWGFVAVGEQVFVLGRDRQRDIVMVRGVP